MTCAKAGLIIVLLSASPGFCGTPTEAVREFYDHPGLELEQSARDRFVDPARKKLEENAAILASGELGCLDPGLAFDSPQADPKEIAATLKMAEAVKGDEAKVLVAFAVEKRARRMEWKLKNVGGAWKIADILSLTGEWALSQFGCE